MLMTEVYLSIKPNTGMRLALNILPSGVKYQGMRCVCLHSLRLCALTGGEMSVTGSLESVSGTRPSVYFVPTLPLLIIRTSEACIFLKGTK